MQRVALPPVTECHAFQESQSPGVPMLIGLDPGILQVHAKRCSMPITAWLYTSPDAQTRLTCSVNRHLDRSPGSGKSSGVARGDASGNVCRSWSMWPTEPSSESESRLVDGVGLVRTELLLRDKPH